MTFRKNMMLGLLSSTLLFACDAKKAEEDALAAAEESTTNDGADVDGASDVLAAVNENMLPASLVSDLPGLRLDGNPCEGTAGFFDCQPNLLKLYLSIAKQSTSSITQLLAGAAEGIQALGVSEGSLVPNTDDDSGLSKLDYKIRGETDYELLFHTAGGPFMYLSVKDNVYELKGNMANAPESDSTGLVHSKVTYTDDDNFAVDVKILNMPCNNDDVRAPQNIAITITKEAGVWQGKSMLYLPRWLTADGAACTLEPSAATKLFMYTDFVGNDEQTTAALYMANSTVTGADQLSSWTAADFCSNWSGACNNGYGFGDPNPVATYKNNFCVSDQATAWNSNCTTSEEAKISAGTFSAASGWILPANLGNLTETLPSSL